MHIWWDFGNTFKYGMSRFAVPESHSTTYTRRVRVSKDKTPIIFFIDHVLQAFGKAVAEW